MNSFRIIIGQVLLLCFLLSFATVNAQQAKIDSLEQILKKHTTADTTRVKLLNDLALNTYRFDSKKARTYVEESEKIADKIHYSKGKAACLWLYGLTFLQTDRQVALDYFQKAVALGEEVGDKSGVCTYLLCIGLVTKAMGDMEKAKEIHEKAFQMAKELNDPQLVMRFLYSMSQDQARQGDYQGAIQQLHEVIRIANETGDKLMTAKVLGQLGFVNERLGNYLVSLEHYLSALEINEQENDKSGVFYNLLNIANIQSELKDFDTSVKTIQRAYQLSKEMGDSLRVATCLVSMGTIYLRMNNPDAIKCFQQALHISKGYNVNQTIKIHTQIGLIYTNDGEFDKAQKHLEEALHLALKTNYKRGCCEIWIKMGSLCFARKQYGKAIELMEKALRLAEELKVLDFQRDSYQLLSQFYAAKGDFNNAYRNQVQFKLINDSIFNEKNIRKIAILESSYEFAKERQVYLVETENQKMKIKSQRQIIVLLAVVSILILILACFIYWSNKLKKRVLKLEIDQVNNELEMNQKAMTSATLKLIQTSERDAYSIKVLENIKKNTLEEGQNEIRTLITNYKLKSHNANWEEFEILFEKVNASFYEKLNELCPTLTPNERKLCVFLKLNMSNNHISQITFQSEEALKKARLRLRRKLNLERDINLSAFIQSL